MTRVQRQLELVDTEGLLGCISHGAVLLGEVCYPSSDFLVEEVVDFCAGGGDPVAAVLTAGGADEDAALAELVDLETELAVVDLEAQVTDFGEELHSGDGAVAADVEIQNAQEGTIHSGGEFVDEFGWDLGFHAVTLSYSQLTADDDDVAGEVSMFEDDFVLEFEGLEDVGDDAHAGDAAGCGDLAPGGRVAVVELLVGDDEVEDVLVVVGVGFWGHG